MLKVRDSTKEIINENKHSNAGGAFVEAYSKHGLNPSVIENYTRTSAI